MSRSIWSFPAASCMVFSWEMFLAGLAPAGRITLVLWDRLGQKGTCQLVKQQVAGFLQEEHCSGPHAGSCSLEPWLGSGCGRALAMGIA